MLISNSIYIKNLYASMAQQVEHFHGKEGVAGSNPAGSLN